LCTRNEPCVIPDGVLGRIPGLFVHGQRPDTIVAVRPLRIRP
jgi:hypothetical protein